MDSIRQLIINAVDARLKTITTANGYNHDLGFNVFEWRDTAISDAELPALIYRDISCETTYFETHRHKLHMEVELIIKDISAGAVRKMISDVLKAIGTDVQWSLLAINTHPEGDEMMIKQSEKVIGGAIVRFAIEFRTVEWDPYTAI